MKKKQIIILIVMILLFIAALITIYFLTREEETENLTGTVLISGDNYLMLEANNEDCIINNINSDYEIGDEVTITYKKGSIKNTNPKEVNAITDKLVKESKQTTENSESQIDKDELEENNTSKEENIETNKNQTSSNTNSNTNNNISSNNSNNSNTNTSKENNTTNENSNKTETNKNTVTAKSADEAVLTYVREIEEDTNNGITDSLKSGFITVVDFLFYDGTIAGHTFNELTTSAKLEVLKAALWIDDKVDSVFPGYKETISNGANKVYTSVKNLIVEAYLNITTSICENNSELCENAKEDFQSLKKSFGFTWDLIKDLASSGLDKLKDWYEIWSGK